MSTMLRRTLSVAAVGSMLASSTIAQTWPDKPVRVVVAFTAGGTTDILARKQLVGERDLVSEYATRHASGLPSEFKR